MWHETTHVGMARSPCGCYVVANYWPPGNWMVAGEFEANVQRPDPSKYAAFKQQEDEAAEAAKVKCQKCAQAIPVGQAYMPTPQVHAPLCGLPLLLCHSPVAPRPLALLARPAVRKVTCSLCAHNHRGRAAWVAKSWPCRCKTALDCPIGVQIGTSGVIL